MRLDSLVRLTEGTLLTSPSVSATQGYALRAGYVERGKAYFALDRLESSIAEAVTKGAYAIIVDKETAVTDPEIAWIRVENIEMAMIRLLRFEIASKHHTFTALNTLEDAIMRALSLPKSLCLLGDSLARTFHLIMDAPEATHFFSPHLALLNNIAPQFQTVPPLDSAPVRLDQSTLFHSTFLHEGRYFKHLGLSEIFIDTFVQVITFLEALGVTFDPFALKPIDHFEPLFVDKRLKVHPFGTTRQALIVESDPLLFEKEIAYIHTHYPHLPLFTCKPANTAFHVKTSEEYTSSKELLTLDPYAFRYALILGDKAAIEATLNTQTSITQPSLF
jgi:ferrochelatase